MVKETINLDPLNGKSQVGSINVLEPGEGYENKLKTCEPAGINTALDRITINNHDYKTGEIVTYTADDNGTAIEGLSSDKKYYVYVIDDNTFQIINMLVLEQQQKIFISKQNSMKTFRLDRSRNT